MLRKIIQKSDLLGQDVRLYYNEKETIKSTLGGIITLSMIILTLSFAWLIGKDVIYKANPFSYQQQIVNSRYFNNTINKTTFPIAFSIVDLNNVPLRDSAKYFNLLFRFVNHTFDENGNLIKTTKDKIELEKCKYEDFPTISEKEFNGSILMNAFCPQMTSASVHGYWSESTLGFLSAIVELCDYDQPNNTCPSYEEIKNYMAVNNFNLGLYVLEPQIVYSNYIQPVQKYVINPYKFANNNMKIINYMIERDYVQTDAGLFFESLNFEEFFRLRELQTDTAFFDNTTKVAIECDFYSSNLETIYIRRYIKVPEVLASTGGLFKFFMLIGYYLNFKFAKINTRLLTLSSIFVVEDGNDKIPNSQKNFSELQLEQTSKMNNFMRNSKGVLNIENENNNQMCLSKENKNNNQIIFRDSQINLYKKIKSRKAAKINLTCSEYYILFCNRRKRNRNITMYKLASKKIKNYTDIIFMMKKMIEVDIIKNLYLNDAENKILNFIKPILNEFLVTENKSTISEKNVDYLQNLLLSLNNSEIDQKVINLLNNFF